MIRVTGIVGVRARSLLGFSPGFLLLSKRSAIQSHEWFAVVVAFAGSS